MKTLETARLILRQLTTQDFAAIHSYASRVDATTYMLFGPNTEDETHEFINRAIKKAETIPCEDYQYAVVQRDTGMLIGSCNLWYKDENKAELGWILHPDYWQKGYGYEMAKRLIEFAFNELNIHRVIATCDSENTASFRLMEKLGMRREGYFLDARPANKNSQTGREFSDKLSYTLLKSEWKMANEISYYNALPFEFNDFIDVPMLSNGEIYLVCTAKQPGDPIRNWIPGYQFAICKGGEQIGHVSLRIGYGGGPKNDNLYYGGQIGYGIDEAFRGNGYAMEACKLLLPIAHAHKMSKLLITNNYTNIASRRVCEKLGARLVRLARLPEHSDLYKNGQRFANIFEWDLSDISC